MKPFSKEPCVSKVLRVLCDANDFLTGAQIAARLPEEPVNRISSSLSYLERNGAIAYLDSDKNIWWYATPDTDKRTRRCMVYPEGITRKRRTGIMHKKDRKARRNSFKPKA